MHGAFRIKRIKRADKWSLHGQILDYSHRNARFGYVMMSGKSMKSQRCRLLNAAEKEASVTGISLSGGKIILAI